MSNFDLNDDNPFQAPTTVEVAPQNEVEGDAASIRRHHLKHEASIQGIGSLYVIGGVFSVIAGLMYVSTMAVGPGAGIGIGGNELLISSIVMLLVVGIGVLQLFTGLGMRKVRPWTKIPATILAVITLINIPIGTLLGFYILYLLHSSKGQVVLANSYQDIIAATPEIKYKTSIIVKVFVVILLVVVGLGLIAALVNA